MSTQQILMLLEAVSGTIGVGVLFLFRHRISSARAYRKAERLRREEAAGIPPSARDYRHAISFNSFDVIVTDLRCATDDSVAMRWTEVARAVAFKRDLLAVDCICLLLARTDGTGVELNEEMARWNSLMEKLPLHLPTSKPWTDWFSTVAFPAFSANETEIYARGVTQIAEPVEKTNVG